MTKMRVFSYVLEMKTFIFRAYAVALSLLSNKIYYSILISKTASLLVEFAFTAAAAAQTVKRWAPSQT